MPAAAAAAADAKQASPHEVPEDGHPFHPFGFGGSGVDPEGNKSRSPSSDNPWVDFYQQPAHTDRHTLARLNTLIVDSANGGESFSGPRTFIILAPILSPAGVPAENTDIHAASSGPWPSSASCQRVNDFSATKKQANGGLLFFLPFFCSALFCLNPQLPNTSSSSSSSNLPVEIDEAQTTEGLFVIYLVPNGCWRSSLIYT